MYIIYKKYIEFLRYLIILTCIYIGRGLRSIYVALAMLASTP